MTESFSRGLSRRIVIVVIVSVVVLTTTLVVTAADLPPLARQLSASMNCSLPVQQYDALQSLYESTAGADWCLRPSQTPWNFTDVDLSAPCVDSWVGVTCTCADGLFGVTNVTLSSLCLAGSIPGAIADLSDLVVLDLQSNVITGSMPASLTQLTALQQLDLGDNELTGSILSDIGQLSALQFLLLNSNSLSQKIPSSIGQLTALNRLSLFSNNLNGTVPSSIGQLKFAQAIFIYSNNLTGTIPASITRLSSLQNLYLDYNSLSGTIPLDIDRLSSLQQLVLYANRLTGTIPTTIGGLSLAVYIDLDSNRLTGSIPSEMALLSALQDVFLFANHLSGTIPPAITQLTALRNLYLFSNFLTGTIPSGIGSLTALQALHLSYNLLTSSVPSSIVHLSSLQQLLLATNELTGEFFGLLRNHTSAASIARSLSSLYITNNLFSGQISINFTQFNGLTALASASNCFSGTIPSSICDLSSTLTTLHLGSLGGNPRCSSNLHVNRKRPFFVNGTFSKLGLQGTIPSCLMAFPKLTLLQLSSNSLHGTIPSITTSTTSASGSSSSSLTNLILSYNTLTGTIPASIQRHSFTELDLSHNRLHGTLVKDFVLSPQQTTLFLSVNRLSGDLPDALTDESIEESSMRHQNLSNLDILVNNIFACDTGEIPSRDINAKSYFCGSYELNVASYSWLIIGGSLTAAYCLLSYYLYVVRPAVAGESMMNGAVKSSTNTDSTKASSLSIAASSSTAAEYGKRLVEPFSEWWSAGSFVMQRLNDARSCFDNRTNSSSKVFSARQSIISHRRFGRNSMSKSGTVSDRDLSVDKFSWATAANLLHTWAFMLMLQIIQRFSGIILLVSVFAFMPMFAALNSTGSSIVSFDYGYGVSMTFLHGFLPVFLIGFTLLLIVAVLAVFTRTLHDIFNQLITENLSGNSNSTSIPSSEQNPRLTNPSVLDTLLPVLKICLLLLVLHGVNLFVTLLINGVYVTTLLSNSSMTRANRLELQVIVGAFKLVWNRCYIPWAFKQLQKFTSDYSFATRHRMIFSITNFIAAPCIATIAVNQSCFYYVFKAAPEITTTFTMNECQTSYTNGEDLVCTKNVQIYISSSSDPSFSYSYACGTALLVVYVPILIYSYIIYSLLPVARLVLAANSERIETWSEQLRSVVKRCGVESRELSGRSTLYEILVHCTIFFTFGIVSPILGIIIAFSIMLNGFVEKLLLGRTFSQVARHPLSTASAEGDESKLAMSMDIAHHSDNVSGKIPETAVERNTWISPFEVPFSSPSILPASGSTADTAPVEILILENITMKNSWKALFVCFHLMVITIFAFWSLMFFDMIADSYGWLNGLLVTISYCVGAPIIPLMIFYREDALPASWKARVRSFLINFCSLPVSASTEGHNAAGSSSVSSSQDVTTAVTNNL